MAKECTKVIHIKSYRPLQLCWLGRSKERASNIAETFSFAVAAWIKSQSWRHPEHLCKPYRPLKRIHSIEHSQGNLPAFARDGIVIPPQIVPSLGHTLDRRSLQWVHRDYVPLVPDSIPSPLKPGDDRSSPRESFHHLLPSCLQTNRPGECWAWLQLDAWSYHIQDRLSPSSAWCCCLFDFQCHQSEFHPACSSASESHGKMSEWEHQKTRQIASRQTPTHLLEHPSQYHLQTSWPLHRSNVPARCSHTSSKCRPTNRCLRQWPSHPWANTRRAAGGSGPSVAKWPAPHHSPEWGPSGTHRWCPHTCSYASTCGTHKGFLERWELHASVWSARTDLDQIPISWMGKEIFHLHSKCYASVTLMDQDHSNLQHHATQLQLLPGATRARSCCHSAGCSRWRCFWRHFWSCGEDRSCFCPAPAGRCIHIRQTPLFSAIQRFFLERDHGMPRSEVEKAVVFQAQKKWSTKKWTSRFLIDVLLLYKDTYRTWRWQNVGFP